jgi:phosphatidylglycerophosphate synthase
MAGPSIAELRRVTQPASIFERNSGEHWAGRLYIRRLSPYVTRALLRTPLSPNAVTWLMIACGIAAGAVLTLPGLVPAIAAFLLIQLQILLDCSDGELARWQKRHSTAGIYLDRIGHVLTAIALPVGLGVRADGGWDSLGGHTTLGLLIAVLCVFVWAQSAFVHVARAEAGKPVVADTADVAAPRASGLRRLRRLLSFAPFFRAFVAMEFTVLALVAAVIDEIDGGLSATRALVVAMVPLAAVTAAGRLAAILASDRLR